MRTFTRALTIGTIFLLFVTSAFGQEWEKGTSRSRIYSTGQGEGSIGLSSWGEQVLNIRNVWFRLSTRGPESNTIRTRLHVGKGEVADVSFLNSQVGIGTTTPSEKLTVNGDVRASEVIVEPKSDIPDYVFADDYDLPTLAEVSAFIDEQGHLPAVPSAESVEKNGLHLGQMDATLLRKVEELTLYAIEQQERADSLAAVVRDQRRALGKQQGALEEVRERLRDLERAVEHE